MSFATEVPLIFQHGRFCRETQADRPKTAVRFGRAESGYPSYAFQRNAIRQEPLLGACR